MTSGTQGFADLSGDINPIGSVMSRIIEARRLAKEEYDFAQKEAEKYQTSLQEAGIPKGYFFKRALQYKFGGEYAENTTNKIKNLRSQASQIKGSVTKKGYSKSERVNMFLDAFDQKAKKSKFRDRFVDLYKDSFVDDPLTRPMSSLVKPGSRRKFQKAVFGDDLEKKKRIQKEDILRVLAGISDSLSATAKSISENTSGISANLIQAHNVQNELVQQIKYNGSTIEDKLDQIVKVLSTQNQIQDQAVRNEKTRQQETQLEQQTISSQDVSFDDLQTKEDESNQPDITEISRPRGGPPSLADIPKPGMDYPQLEHGGIVSGPDTGYPVTLHGTEAVIPLKNRATDNINGNEVTKKDGSVNPVSKMIPQYERGTFNSSIKMSPQYERGTTPQFNKLDFNPTSTTQSSVIAQDVLNAMSLPKKAVGAELLSSTTDYMNNVGSDHPQLSSEIAKVQRPIAKTFDLSASTVNVATKNKSFARKKEDDKKTALTDKKKNILEQIGDSVKDLFDDILEKINGGNPPGDNPPPTGPADLSPVDLKGFSPQDVSNLGKMIYAEAGADQEGSSQVMNTILNRYREIKQGKITPQEWGVRAGVTAQNMTLTDLLMATNQYQPVRDGRFNQVSADQATQALNAAIAGGGLDPKQIYEKAKASGMSDADARTLAVADSFANDYGMRNNRPFNTPAVRTDNGHSFLSSPSGFKPGDLNTLTPVQREQPDTRPASQRIERNYGQEVESRVRFKLNGQWYNAFKTTNGFDFYNEGGSPLPFDDVKVTDPKELEPLIREFVKLKTKGQGDQALLTPTDQRQQQVARAQGIAKEIDSSMGNQIALLNIGGTSGQPSSGSEQQNTSEDVISAQPTSNPLASLYNSPYNPYLS